MDPANTTSLCAMETPKTADALSQFTYCARWMALTIPEFTKRSAPLTELIERAYAKSGKLTTRSIKGMQLCSLAWGPNHADAFKDVQSRLLSATKLAYPNSSKTLCLHTDDSDRYWSAVLTHIERAQLQLPTEKQRHEPLAFLGSEFKKAHITWTTDEKEAFAIFQAFKKLDNLFLNGQDTRIFTDHRNFLFVFSPLEVEPSLGKHIISKVLRWAIYLSNFDYVIEHIDGERNVFADILTR